jgi:predicted porin
METYQQMKWSILLLAALGSVTSAAQAESSVTLYGLIDTGITYVNSSKTATGGTATLFKFDDGVAKANRLGLRGTEDLGGGLKAIFVVENGFSAANGRLGQGGALFGRQAYAGLTKDDIGSLTLGRQYSFSTDYLGKSYSTGGVTVAGNYGYHVNDIDQLLLSRINNSVKFSSANYAGFTVGGMYGFSNQAGAFGGAAGTGAAVTEGSSRAYSFGANYAAGPFGLGAAYTDIRFPGQSTPAFSTALANVNPALGGQIRDLRTYGIGGRYRFGGATLWALWTDTRLEALTGAATTYSAYEAGGKYAFTQAITGSLGYTYTKLSNTFSGHWNQIDTSVDYALNKRTDVYLLGIYQKASGNNHGTALQAQIGTSTSFLNTSGSGSSTQAAVRVGIYRKF